MNSPDGRPTPAPMGEDIPATVPPAGEEAVPATRLPDEESPPTRAPSPSDSPTPLLPPVAAELEGVQVPGYEIERELGRGGMGVVYLARQVDLNRLVALKMIRTGPWATSAERQRLLREARLVA